MRTRDTRTMAGKQHMASIVWLLEEYMPNHTTNRLIVTGQKVDVDAFVLKSRGDDGSSLSFRKFIPCSESIDAQRIAWGTKWDAYSENLDYQGESPLALLASASLDDDSEVSATYTFDTAWSEPSKVVAAMIEQHPELTFDHSYLYEDGGGGHAGRDYSTSFEDGSEEERDLYISMHGVDPWRTCCECWRENTSDPNPDYRICEDCEKDQENES